MSKKLLLFLISLVGAAILMRIYFVFEIHILESLSIEPNEQPEKLLLQIYLGIPFLLLLVLTFWIINLYDKYKKLDTDIQDLLKDNNELQKLYAEKRKGKIKYKKLLKKAKKK